MELRGFEPLTPAERPPLNLWPSQHFPVPHRHQTALDHFLLGTLPVMHFEEPAWDGPYFGQFGVLADDGDKVQCHVCGG